MDPSLFQFISADPLLSSVTIFFASWFPYIVALAAACLAYAYSPQDGGKRIALIFIPAVIAYLAAEYIKYLYPMPRPYVALEVLPLVFVSDPLGSFPSSHAAFFSALAAGVFLLGRKFGVLFFAATLVIVAARVVAHIHSPVDVIVGLALGLLIGGIGSFFWKKLFLKFFLTE